MKKIFSLLVIVITGMVMTGCGKEVIPVKPDIVIETQDVHLAVGKDVPKVSCNFAGPGVTPLLKLLECVIEHKHVNDAFSKK